jgi:selenide, water dikinase
LFKLSTSYQQILFFYFMMKNYKLTQFSPGAGCGCKISSIDLEKILEQKTNNLLFEKLIVGNESKDDAAVWALDAENGVISTTDFFTPVVDDAFYFGKIAAVNAISDVYAMGGKPILAIAVLGWPLEKIPAGVAAKVIEGARAACCEAGIPLAGGHSIDISDPVFGLAVTGTLKLKNLKRNSSARPESKIYITKPIGIGLYTTAQKRNLLSSEDELEAITWMSKLNKQGEFFGELNYVSAMTDVTGFGLLGHLCEICEGSNLKARLRFGKVPLLNKTMHYLNLGTIPGGTSRNWNSYKTKVNLVDDVQKNILCDPQTSGGLLVIVDNASVVDFENYVAKQNIEVWEIGSLDKKIKEKEALIEVA